PMYSANGSTSSAVAVPGSSGGTSVVVTGSHPSGSVLHQAPPPPPLQQAPLPLPQGTAASTGKSAAKSASAFVAASASIDNSGVNSESDDPLSSGPGGAPGSANSNSKKKTVPTISTGRRCLKSEKVNSEESVRRAKRRERNRVAAAKCRKKRQDQIECLTDEASGLENDNSELEAEIAELLNRKSQLMCLLQAHQLECPEAASNLVIPALPPISLELSRQSQQQHQQTPTPPSLRSNSPGDLDNDPIDEGAALHPASSAAVGKSFNKPTQAAATAADFDPNKSGIEPESFTVVLNNPSTSSQQHPQQTTLLPPLHSIVSSLPSLSFASSAGQINCAQSQPQSADGDRQQQQLPPDLAPLFALKQETFLHL
uniref:BZIP domain-containing protein n=1 Tax=Macrostomum lignano TaxID=282301 RepID=A0A1I8HEP3_9PLAT